MVKITKLVDLEMIPNLKIVPHIRNLLEYFLKEYNEYCSDCIDPIGAIFILDCASDWRKYFEMGLSEPIKKESFEWILPIGDINYKIGCINIDTDRSIDIVAESSLFATFCE